jgi:hypothetical protein
MVYTVGKNDKAKLFVVVAGNAVKFSNSVHCDFVTVVGQCVGGSRDALDEHIPSIPVNSVSS